MGNGEQYIWKPPEDDDMFMLQSKALAPLGSHTVENIQPSAAAVSEDSSAWTSISLGFFFFFLKFILLFFYVHIFMKALFFSSFPTSLSSYLALSCSSISTPAVFHSSVQQSY